MKIGPDEFGKAPHGCAWNGCVSAFHGDMPAGWRWLISYHDRGPTIGDWTKKQWQERPYADLALCPAHARELFSNIKCGDTSLNSDVSVFTADLPKPTNTGGTA